ncbi:alpha/beta hydrolase [Antribacter sp. KLBMP9083]|uniref:Alpha/beta hydrolase n=1 Tax=Antribacter soli TaxID=2910976 RepID=A0AA41QI73_9MICO|nr:alpha/beta hydrolase [Antribacter soli]MCF4123491.1 alpha/beta hydrolase [Antribacter soli]
MTSPDQSSHDARAPRPGVVFVHGMRTSSAIWEQQLEHVRAAGHEAVAVDLPAHGALRDARFSMPGAFDALDDAAASLDPAAPVALVGLSLGGYTSLAWAARRTPVTDRLAGVLVSGCTTDPRGKPVAAYRELARRVVAGHAAVRTAGRSSLAWAESVRQAGGPWLLRPDGARLRGPASAPGGADLRTLTVAPGQAAGPYRPGWDVVTDALSHLAGRSSLTDVRALEVPVWFVNGARDTMRLEEQRHLAAARDGALVVVPGAGHDVNTDAPDAYNRVLTRALGDFARV